MTFGQQPRGNGQYEPQGAQGLNTTYQTQSNYQAPYAQTPYAGAATFDTTPAYSYEQARSARRTSVAKAYGEMTIGLIVTAVVAYLSAATGLFYRFLMATGMFGMIGVLLVQVGLAIFLSARVMRMRPATARISFYVYAALMGFTLSTVLGVYAPGTVVTTLAVCAVFFLCLTMLALTTKIDMTRFAPIFMVGLIVLIVVELVLMFLAPSNTMLMIVSGIGVVLFAGMTMFDAQQTRQIFAAYETQGPEMVQRVSILCALNLYLDFVNMFLYLLRLIGVAQEN